MTRLALIACGLLLWFGQAVAQPLTSFENAAELAVLSPSQLQAEQSSEHATDGQHSLKVTVKGSTTDTWPGLVYTPANPDLSQAAVLALDVFNAQDFPVTLSFRLDDASGKNHFTGTTLKPGANKVELWLTSVRFILDMKHLTQIYPYFSKPRQDAVLFFDHLRLEAVSTRFKAVVFEETIPEPATSDTDRARGYVVFARPWLSTIFPDSRPLPTELAPTLSVFGCPGQTLPVTFCVRALQDLGQTGIAPEALAAGKSQLAAEALRVYPVSTRDKRLHYSSDYYIKDMPALLERREFVDVPKGRTQQFWINVTIPENQAPGLYRGQVTVKPTQGQATAVPVQVRVLPYRLVESRRMFFGEYYTSPPLAKTPEEKLAAVERDLKDQREHGMTSLGLCYGLEHEEFAVEGTNVTLNLQPQGLYTKTMETYQALGFPLPVLQLNDTGQTAAQKHPFGTADYVATYQNFWIELAKLHKERGWPEVIVQPVDEPAWQGPDERARNLACLKWLKEIPGQRTEQDGPVDSYFISEAGPFADVWNGNGAVPAPEAMQQAQAAGKIVMCYNNDVESYRPEMGRYCNGFFQLRAGARGTFNWAYISIAGNPYDDQDAETGSWMHFYPPLPEIGEVGGPSTGWEGARAGVDDYKVAFTLQRAIERAEKSPRRAARQAAQAGRQALADVLASLQFDRQPRGSARFAEELPGPDGGKIVRGNLRVPNGWEVDTYDRVRWRLCQATMDVLAALGEIRSSDRGGGATAPSGPAGAFVAEANWSRRPATSAGAASGVHRQVTIPIVATPPACDGDLSDPVWQQAAKLDPFVRMDGSGVPTQQTTVRLCADSAKLYVAAELAEENIAHLTARVDQDGGPVWQDDCLELFVDPTLQRQSFVQIVINPLGKILLSHPADKSWQPEVLRAAKVDKDGRRWIVELGVPLAGLGLTSNAFGLNVCRERRPLESLELSCWSATGQGFAHPDRFGVATIGGSTLTDFRVGRGVLGVNELSATLRNDESAPRNYLAILDWRQGKRVALYRQKGPIALAPGQSMPVVLPYEITSDHEPVALRLTIKDADTGRLYAERSLEQQILPALSITLKPNLYYLSDGVGLLHAEINLDENLQDQATLTVALFRAGGALPVRSQTLQLNNERLDAVVNVAGLPAGVYRLEAIIKSGSNRLATAKATVTKVPGPF